MNDFDDLRARLGGRYDIERELGRGGMGAVYLARDVQLGRLVALKVLPPEFATQMALRERFLRETRTAASFSHPNIVPVYAIEETEDVLAYVMGYVEGETLAERVHRAGPLSTRETVKLLQDVGYALAYANGRGIVHRDIKPDNIMVERATGRALVMDFGVARIIAAPGPSGNDGLTRVGEVVGTPEYMSPEQATGDHVDGRSDLYSLGLAAYYALTGRVAMAADSTGRSLAKQITEILPPMRSVRPDLPAALCDAIDRCVMKEPDARFENAEALVEALDAAQLGTPDIPVPIRLFAQEVATLSMVTIGGALLLLLVSRSYEPGSDLDTIIPFILIVGVLLTRLLQTLSEARRLAVDGFTAEGILRGFRAVVAERQSRRDELRANPIAMRRRRRGVLIGASGVVLALVCAKFAFSFRVQTGPRQYSTSPPGVVLILVGALAFGVGLSLLARSPFTMPLGERLFRVMWLGPVGQAFVRFAGRGTAREGGTSATSNAGSPRATALRASSSAASVAGVASAANTASVDRVGQLEARVSELERWRAGR
jgi:eukaryotic-like serine/threonine-protein kinase